MTITAPGFVDLQVNGFAGVDFNTPGQTDEDLHHAIGAVRATGVTRLLPTLITSSFEHFAACVRPLVRLGHDAIAGIHVEGPYISPLDGPRGAHPAAHVRPASIDDYRRREEAADGRIRLVTLAPEIPGALRLIEHLAAAGVVVGIGHTAATGDQIRDAIGAGASLSTHLGNGCGERMHRHDNPIWPQLAADALSASFIADGHHLPADVLKSFVRAKGLARSILVTDAVAAAAAPPGRYRIGDVDVRRDDNGRIALFGTPYLAGSSLTMDAAVANTVRFTGSSLNEILPLASTQPAAVIGIEPAGTVSLEWDESTCRLSVLGAT